MNTEKESLIKPEGEAAPEAGRSEQGGESASPAPQMTATGTGLPEDLAAYRKELAAKQELYDRLLRKQAELENFRKRIQREKEDFLQHATADLVRSLLPTLDGFERALKQRDSGVPEHFSQGIELIYRELLEVLGRAGLAPIETAGRVFDPHYHQAVETVEAEGYRDQEIVEELQRGYTLKRRLLRPAIVKVAVARRAEGTKPETESAGS